MKEKEAMKIFKSISGIRSEYIDEAESPEIKKTFPVKRFAASAAAAAVFAFALGIYALSGRFRLSSGSQSPEQKTETGLPESAATQNYSEDGDEIVEVELSYNERIQNGEEVKIETYIDERTEHQGFAYTLKNITVSSVFPEGITKDDISNTPSVAAYTDADPERYPEGYTAEYYDYGEYAAEHGLPPIESEKGYGDPETGSGAYTERALYVSDVIDENGLYIGPKDVPDEGYKWLFLELEIENLSDEERLEYLGDMDVCGGVYLDCPRIRFTDERGIEQDYYSDYIGYSYFGNHICYMSEHTDKIISDNLPDGVAFYNMSFSPREKKRVILGYCISDHFVYGELVLQLHNAEAEKASSQRDMVYLPLK